MIEAGANEIPEDKMIEAIYKCDEVNKEIIKFFDKIIAECGKEKHEYLRYEIPQDLNEALYAICPPEEMENRHARRMWLRSGRHSKKNTLRMKSG